MIPRELIKGTLKYMVLNLLQTLPRMYGYEITQVLDEKILRQDKTDLCCPVSCFAQTGGRRIGPGRNRKCKQPHPEILFPDT